MYRGLMSVFFFSSRRRHTRLQGDWSSDVCSSDLRRDAAPVPGALEAPARGAPSGRGRQLDIEREVFMYDHIGLKVKDVDASVRFYENALKAFGYVLCSRDDSGAGFGPRGEPALW